jgi:hypothetical protein
MLAFSCSPCTSSGLAILDEKAVRRGLNAGFLPRLDSGWSLYDCGSGLTHARSSLSTSIACWGRLSRVHSSSVMIGLLIFLTSICQ